MPGTCTTTTTLCPENYESHTESGIPALVTAGANISLSTPDHGHIVQGRLRESCTQPKPCPKSHIHYRCQDKEGIDSKMRRNTTGNGCKSNASGVDEAALHDIRFLPATPGGHTKPPSDDGCPADRQWSLSASAADTVEANNSPLGTANGCVSAPLSREASPPSEGMMTPPRCEAIAGLAENTPRYTPRYSPRMTARQRATPGENLFLDGVDEAREPSPFGECEGYFSKLQVHDSSLALTVTDPTQPPLSEHILSTSITLPPPLSVY